MKRLDLSSQKLRALVYGVPGAGKTTFAGTAAMFEETSPVLWIDMAGNPESAFRLQSRFVHTPDVVIVESIEDLNRVYKWVSGGMKSGTFSEKYGLLGNGPYKTLVIDGITELQRKITSTVIGAEQSSEFIQYGTKLSWDAHGAILGVMLRVAKMAYLDLPDMHIIITALEQTTRIEADSDDSRSFPRLSGQSRSELPGYANLVMRMVQVSAATSDVRAFTGTENLTKFSSSTRTLGLVAPSTRWEAKDQFGLPFKFMFNPTVERFVTAARETLEVSID